MFRKVKKVPRKGTVALLRLTKDMKQEDKDEIIEYISHLEQNEDALAGAINNFWNSVSENYRPKVDCKTFESVARGEYPLGLLPPYNEIKSSWEDDPDGSPY